MLQVNIILLQADKTIITTEVHVHKAVALDKIITAIDLTITAHAHKDREVNKDKPMRGHAH